MTWGQRWDRLTGGPRRRQRQMLRRLAQLDRLDRLDAAARSDRHGWRGGSDWHGGSDWRGGVSVPTQPPRRRGTSRIRWSATGMVAVVVSVTAGLAFVRLTATIDDHTGRLLDAGSLRPSGRTVESLSRLEPLPTAPPGTGGYAFLLTNARGPAAYDPCRSVQFVLNEELNVPDAAGMVRDALAMASQPSGLRLVLAGPTDELATAEARPSMDRARYGDRWSPVLVAFTSPARDPRLDGRVAGVGGSTALANAQGVLVNVTGSIHLDTPDLRQILTRRNGRSEVVAIIAHEVGHVLGLGHVDDPGQLMNAQNTGQIGFADGDRRGLALLADRPCQLEF